MRFSFLVRTMLICMVAVVVSGCALFSLTPEQQQAILKTVTSTTANLVVLAYNAGGKDLAYTKIDDMVATGKLTPSQATALKADVDAGINQLPKIFGAQLMKVSRPVAAPAK